MVQHAEPVAAQRTSAPETEERRCQMIMGGPDRSGEQGVLGAPGEQTCRHLMSASACGPPFSPVGGLWLTAVVLGLLECIGLLHLAGG